MIKIARKKHIYQKDFQRQPLHVSINAWAMAIALHGRWHYCVNKECVPQSKSLICRSTYEEIEYNGSMQLTGQKLKVVKEVVG